MLIGAIVLVMVILIVVMISRTIKSHYDALQEDLPCASQVLAHSVAVRESREAAAPTITCPTRRVTLEADASVRERQEEVAKQMARCWKVWGRGELALFGEEEGVYCHVCATIRLEDGKDLSGVPAFLDSAKYNKTHTYAQFMAARETGTYFDEETFPDATTLAFPGDTPIGVLFVYAKGNEWYRDAYNTIIANPRLGALSGATAGYLTMGAVTAPLGVGNPISFVARYAGAVAGAEAGFLMALRDRAPNSFFAGVVVRPLAEGDLETLGCLYAPVDET